MKSYDVKFWAIRPGKAKTKRTYEIRWKVGPTPHSSTLGNKAQADSFLSDLRQAARNGEAFDTDTGLPDSMTKATSQGRSWLDFCLSYVDMKWPFLRRHEMAVGSAENAGRTNRRPGDDHPRRCWRAGPGRHRS